MKASEEKLAKMCKEKMVEELVERFKHHPDFILTNYMGSSVSDMEDLRRDLKKTSAANYVVVKNSILRAVFNKLKLQEESSKIDGGMGLALSGDDIISTCRTLVRFSKTHEKLKIKSAFFDGKSVSLDMVKDLAAIVSKEALLARMLATMKSPITGFANALNGILRKFVYVVEAIKKTKESVKETIKEGDEKDGN